MYKNNLLLASAGRFPRSLLTTAVSRVLRPLPFATAACIVALSPLSQAAILSVSNTDDAGPGSLRQAILDANASPGVDSIQLDALNGVITLTSGALSVTESVSLIGPGREHLTIDANLNSRIFLVDRSELSISGLTLTRGQAPGGESGGAIGFACPDEASAPHQLGLALSDSAVTASAAKYGGAIGLADCREHGPMQLAFSLRNSSLSGNTASASTGGVYFGRLGPPFLSHCAPYLPCTEEGHEIDLTIEVAASEISGNQGGALLARLSRYEPLSQLTVNVSESAIANNAGDGLSFSKYGGRGPTPITIADSSITGNTGTGIRVRYHTAGAEVTVARSSITDNGIGMEAGDGNVLVHDSFISGNTEIGLNLRGLYSRGLYGAITTVRSSTIAGSPLGIWQYIFSRLTLEDSTVSGNDTGVSIYGYYGSQLTGNNSTISNNGLHGITVGGWKDQTSVWLEHSTITNNGGRGLNMELNVYNVNNSLPFAEVRNSLLAGNTGDADAADVQGKVALEYSLIGNSLGADIVETVPGSNLLDLDPLLGPLQDNGGPTATRALEPGSPAINSGDPNYAGPASFDQRGDPYARVVEGRTDMGAFEVQSVTGVQPNPGLARCVGDIDGDGVQDLLHISPQGLVTIRGLDGGLVETFAFQGVDDLVDVELLPDINANGAPELAALGIGRSELRDLKTGDLLGGADLDSSLPRIDLEWLEDYSGNGLPDMASLLADAPTVELREVGNDTLLNSIGFTSYFAPKDLAIHADLNGNGVNELALLGDNLDPLKGDRIEIRDPVSGEKLKVIWLGRGWQVMQQATLPDFNGNGFEELAVLRIENQGNKVQVSLRDSDAGQRLHEIGFGDTYPPQKLLVVDDINGNGADELVVFGQRFNGGNQKAQVRDAKTGELIVAVFFNKDYPGRDFSSCSDINGNGTQELLLLGQRVSDGNIKLFVKDSKTGELIGKVEF